MLIDVIIISLRITLLIFLIIILINFISYSKFLKKERRISAFAVEPSKNKEKSIIEKISTKYLNYVYKKRDFVKKKYKRSIKKYKKKLVHKKMDDNYVLDFITYKRTCAWGIVIFAFVMGLIQGRIISILEVIFYFLFGYYLLDIFMIHKSNNYQKKIDEELLRAVILMNNAFKSGKSTIQAVNTAMMELPAPINLEFAQIYKEMSYGLSIEVAFDRFSKRVKSDEAMYIASSLTILNKTGGNIVKVFSSIEKTLYDKKKLSEEKKMLTTSSKVMVKLLLVLPVLFVLIIFILSPDFFSPLFDSILGYFIIFLIIILFSTYIFILNKILKVGD